MRRVLGSLAVLSVLFPGVSFAQSAPGAERSPRLFLDLNLVDAGTTFAKDRLFTGLFVKFGEQGRIEATYPKLSGRTAFPVDVAVGFFVRPKFALGVGLSRSAQSNEASISARVPHPTLINAPFTGTIKTDALKRVETAIHIVATVVYVRTPRVEWRFSAGPSFFRYAADMVKSVVYSQDALNVVSIDGVTTARARAHELGANAGSDIAVLISRRLAITGGVRFSSAVVTVAHEPLSDIHQDFRVGRKAVLLGIRFSLQNAR